MFCALRDTDGELSWDLDRRNVFVNLRTHVPEKLLKLNNQTRTVQATNDNDKLNVYLYFSEPVLNSSAEILKLLSTNHGDLLPIDGKTNGNRRFAFMVSASTAFFSRLINSCDISLYVTFTHFFFSGHKYIKTCYSHGNS